MTQARVRKIVRPIAKRIVRLTGRRIVRPTGKPTAKRIVKPIAVRIVAQIAAQTNANALPAGCGGWESFSLTGHHYAFSSAWPLALR